MRKTKHGSLHDAVMEAMAKATPDKRQIVYLALVKKLRANGHRLTAARAAQLREASGRIVAGEEAFVAPGGGRSVHLEIGSADVEALRTAIQDAMANAVAIASKRTSTGVGKAIELSWRERRSDVATDREKITRRISREWKVPLSRLDLLLTIAEEVVGEWGARRRSRQQKRYAAVQWAFLARAVLVGREIRHLIAGGFANAAMARWRTLHELDVISSFVRMHGLQAAERFSAHASVGRHKLASAARQEYRPNFLEKLQRERASVVSDYGDGFGKDYGWAEGLGGLSGANFSKLAASVDAAAWRAQYLLACAAIHVSGVGIEEHLGRPSFAPRKAQMSGPGLSDLSLPGGMCVRSLVCLFSTVLSENSTFDDLVSVQVLTDFGRKAISAFDNAEGRIANWN